MKILLIKTSSLGDIIHAFPCLHYLRKKFPEAQIDWVVESGFAEMLRAHPYVHRVLCVETKQWRKGLFKPENRQAMKNFKKALQSVEYDVVFDLQGNIKSGLICACAKGKSKVGFGFSTVPEWPNILFTHTHYNPPKGRNIRLDYLYLVQSFFKDYQTPADEGVLLQLNPEQTSILHQALESLQALKGEKIMVCPGSAWPNKQLSPKSLQDLLHDLKQARNCSFVFIWGTLQEQQWVQALHGQFPKDSVVIDRLSLPVLQNLMDRMDLVLAMDSLPLHLAGTTKVPTWSIFGASSAAKYKPEGPQHRAFQGKCPYGRTFEKRCPILRTCSTGACIRNLKKEELFHYISKNASE